MKHITAISITLLVLAVSTPRLEAVVTCSAAARVDATHSPKRRLANKHRHHLSKKFRRDARSPRTRYDRLNRQSILFTAGSILTVLSLVALVTVISVSTIGWGTLAIAGANGLALGLGLLAAGWDSLREAPHLIGDKFYQVGKLLAWTNKVVITLLGTALLIGLVLLFALFS